MESPFRRKGSPISSYGISKHEKTSVSFYLNTVIRKSVPRPKSHMSNKEGNATPKYIHMLDTFDNMIETFDHGDNIPKSDAKSRILTEPSQRSKSPNSAHFNIKNRPNRIKSKLNFPLSRRFKNYPDYGELVGPGSYFKPLKNESPSFIFPSSSRMSDSIAHKLAEYSRVLRSPTPPSIDHLERNKVSASFNKEAIISNIQFRAKQKKEKMEHVISQKQRLTIDKQNFKRDHINQKLKRYEWRIRKGEFNQMRKSLSNLVVISAMSFIISIKIQSWLIFKRRTRKLYGALFVIIKAVMKFKRILTKIRAKFALGKLVPLKIYLRRKLNQIRKKHRIVILDICEQALYGSISIKLIFILKLKIILIQRNIRRFIICQDARKISLKIKWFKRKEELSKDFSITSGPILKFSIKTEMLNIPEIIIFRYLHEYIRIKISEYNERLDEYQLYCQSLHKVTSNLNISSEELTDQSRKKIVRKPILDIYTKCELLDSLIKEAYTRRFSERKRKNTISPIRVSILFSRI